MSARHQQDDGPTFRVLKGKGVCVSMRAARTAVYSLRYWSLGMWRLDSRNRPVAMRAARMPLTPGAASTAQWCLFSVGPHVAISIFDKT